jgi:hypothetical protein
MAPEKGLILGIPRARRLDRSESLVWEIATTITGFQQHERRKEPARAGPVLSLSFSLSLSLSLELARPDAVSPR